MTVDTDVLIVGAGPTGLMLANQLARRGVRAEIIDRHAGPALQTRALGVQARTLEIYARLGIVNRALELGQRATGANLWARGRKRARVPFGDMGAGLSPYPFLLILGQDDNEKLLGDRLRDWNVSVQWSTELVGLAQESDQVHATIKQSDGSTRGLTAAWIAGCDGGHSAVRDLNQIEFVGAAYEHVFYVADAQATGSMVPDELNIFMWRGGFHLFFPMRGADHWRVIGLLPPNMRGNENLTFDEVIPAIQREAGAELAFQGCSWFSTYRIHHRRAARFRDRRCFLLGDAAHVHSPVGAQGMNTGLQDAYNLAWKLALVVSGSADVTLLDSYAAEREPIAARLLSTTDRAFSLLASDSRMAGLIRMRVMPKALAFAMTREKFKRFAFRAISQTGIRYRASPLSQANNDWPETAPNAGDRFPWLHVKLAPNGPIEDLYEKLDDTRFNLIVIGQPAPSLGIPELGDMLRVHAIADDPANRAELERFKIPERAFYLLRPDGHVGLAGSSWEAAAVSRYLQDCLRLGVRSSPPPTATGG